MTDFNIEPGTEWLHRKTGVKYVVLATAFLEPYLIKVVIYQCKTGGDIWVRPLAEFLDGRFTLLNGVIWKPETTEGVSDRPAGGEKA